MSHAIYCSGLSVHHQMWISISQFTCSLRLHARTQAGKHVYMCISHYITAADVSGLSVRHLWSISASRLTESLLRSCSGRGRPCSQPFWFQWINVWNMSWNEGLCPPFFSKSTGCYSSFINKMVRRPVSLKAHLSEGPLVRKLALYQILPQTHLWHTFNYLENTYNTFITTYKTLISVKTLIRLITDW